MMRHVTMIVTVLLTLFLSFTATPAWALEPIPEQAGFSGFIQPGFGYLNYKSNMVASFSGFDLSNESTDSLADSPDSESNGILLSPFALEYTFTGSRTQLFVGSDLTDIIRFDFSQQFGVKQKMGGWGLVQAGFLFTGIPTEVWSDPYVIGREREDTDRESYGVRLTWDRIGGSRLQLQYTYRDIEIDSERSGEFLGLPSAERGMLARDGERHVVEAAYRIDLSDSHRLVPSFAYAYDDRDGGAMTSDAYDLQLTYLYLDDPLKFTANASIGWADYDAVNPIYGRTQEDDRYVIQGMLYYKNPWNWSLFGSRPMNFFLAAAYAENDANIDFYDQEAFLTTVGIFFKW